MGHSAYTLDRQASAVEKLAVSKNVIDGSFVSLKMRSGGLDMLSGEDLRPSNPSRRRAEASKFFIEWSSAQAPGISAHTSSAV